MVLWARGLAFHPSSHSFICSFLHSFNNCLTSASYEPGAHSSCVALGRPCASLSLSFHLCKVGTVILVPGDKDYGSSCRRSTLHIVGVH